MIVTNLQRPNEEQMKMFMEFSDDAPIKMVNLFLLKLIENLIIIPSRDIANVLKQ